jgi:hypothetical protein
MPSHLGHGVPEPWAAGALSCALFEGLCGVVDTDRNMRSVRVSPRWAAAGVNEVTACVKYEEGGGYIRYCYTREGDTIRLLVAGNSDRRRFEILLPDACAAESLSVDGTERVFDIKRVEQSRYLCFDSAGIGCNHVTIRLAET